MLATFTALGRAFGLSSSELQYASRAASSKLVQVVEGLSETA